MSDAVAPRKPLEHEHSRQAIEKRLVRDTHGNCLRESSAIGYGPRAFAKMPV